LTLPLSAASVLKVRPSRIEVRAERLDVSADRALFTISVKFVLPLSRKKRQARADLLTLNFKTC
jgi:hypothetical protein